jgi:branched-subunit amino acid aminotransferase/4-amino-4-deoxychorismate lyase
MISTCRHPATAPPPSVMTVSSPLHLLFSVTDGQATPLAVPTGPGGTALEDPGQVFDLLPRGVYEAARTFEHHLFVGLEQHLDRMQRSLAFAQGSPDFDREGLRQALDTVARDFPGQDSKLRFDVLGGPAEALGCDSRTIIQAVELRLPPPEVYRDGVRAQLTDLRRHQPAVKHAQWVVDRRQAGGDSPDNFESILVDARGRLLEGTMSNFFWVSGGVLNTAPVEGVLPGITRGFILSLAEELGIETREQAAEAEHLAEIDEAFFTTSVRSVVPIATIATRQLPSAGPGPVTRALLEAYSAFCSANARPAVEA